VEIVIGTYHLGLGGSESYTLAVAEQLQRLGHDLTIFGVQPGPAADVARARGLEVRLTEDELPERCDVLFAQDAVTSYQLVERYPRTPLVYTAHADEYDFCTPPQLQGIVQAVVVLNDRIARHVRSLGVVPEVVRLRQPVDVKRFYPRTPLNEEPRRGLVLGNWVQPDRRRLLRQACADAGIEYREHGATIGAYTREPELELASADIVFGKARVIVEAMASGRAAYVFDHNGGDGWVTPERYDLLEADNFGGQAEAAATGLARLRADLAAYDPAMGPANRDLAVANHSASRHAHELVALFSRLAPQAERADGPLRELSRLARLQWVSESRVLELSAEVLHLRSEVTRLTGNPPWLVAVGAGQVRRLRRLGRFIRDVRRRKERPAHSV
jgi:glycosyltransferase involved in cell wall biosynthesis